MLQRCLRVVCAQGPGTSPYVKRCGGKARTMRSAQLERASTTPLRHRVADASALFAGCLPPSVLSNCSCFFFVAPGASVTISALAAPVAFWAHGKLCMRLVPGRVTHTTSPCSWGRAACSALKADEAVCMLVCDVFCSKLIDWLALLTRPSAQS